ncbi:MAG: hypothetical protein GXP42_06670 [Chloroflexi bacterium]|nr:hypothetical protein [Chloroflexota bacterium]
MIQCERILPPQSTVSRQRLAFLFWPDSREGQAKTNLRQLLHRLRQLFPPIEDYIDFEHALQVCFFVPFLHHSITTSFQNAGRMADMG